MRLRRIPLVIPSLAILAVALGAATLSSQDKPKEMQGAPEAASYAPTPTPHHERLKHFEGAWDATVHMSMVPGEEATTSKGVETNTLGCGGFWLVSDFKGEFMGTPFHGHGIHGFDPVKKKHVGVWVDSMNSSVTTSEGDCDGSCKTLTMKGEGIGPDGAPMKFREVLEVKDANSHTFKMYNVGPDGKEFVSMTIEYKRRNK